MTTLYSVALQTDRAISAGDFPEGMLVSIENTGHSTVRLLVQGKRKDAEKVLRGLKDSIRFYERVDTHPQLVSK